MRFEEDEERKKKKRKKLKRMTVQRDLSQRGQSREKRWEAWEEFRAKREQRDEMRGMRLQAWEENWLIFMGIFIINHQPNGNKGKHACAFWFIDLLWSINFARFERVFCLSSKRNFFQKVVFWAEPNAFFPQLFVLWVFWAPKSANKRTLYQ